jgi:hypothetical protein
MPDIPKPNGPDVNIGASVIALEWALAGVAALVLGLRWVTVAVITRRIQRADYFMVLAFVRHYIPETSVPNMIQICAVVQGVLLTASFEWGLGRHFYYLTDDERFHAMRFLFLLQGWGIASPMFGRISFCLFLLYIVGNNNKRYTRWSLWFAVAAQAIVNLATIVLIYTQCGTHPQKLWDPSVHANCLGPEVQTNFSYFQSGKSYPIL